MTTLAQTATLAWGYTMADLDRLTSYATRRRQTSLIDPGEASAVAWHAIVVALYEATVEPHRRDLVEAGERALGQELNRLRSHHGFDSARARDYRYDHIAPNFHKYWGVKRDSDDGFADRITERLALPAVLATLTPKEYEAISALAAFDNDYEAAARSVGANLNTFRGNVAAARRRLLALWFEHETPRSSKGTPTKCRNGHSRAKHGYVDDDGHLRCKVCRASTDRRAGRRKYQKQKARLAAA